MALEEVVRGTIHVVFLHGGCSVAASYFSPTDSSRASVYWFSQAEIDEVFKSGRSF
jgi:hypothetical protein